MSHDGVVGSRGQTEKWHDPLLGLWVYGTNISGKWRIRKIVPWQEMRVTTAHLQELGGGHQEQAMCQKRPETILAEVRFGTKEVTIHSQVS